MFNVACATNQAEVEKQSSATLERSNSLDSSSVTTECNTLSVTSSCTSNVESGLVSTKKDGERQANFVVDASWSPVVRVVNFAETKVGAALIERAMRAANENDDDMPSKCDGSAAINGSEDDNDILNAADSSELHDGSGRPHMADLLNGTNKQPQSVFRSDKTPTSAATKTKTTEDLKRKNEGEKAVKSETPDKGDAKKPPKTLDVAATDQSTSKAEQKPASSTHEPSKKRHIEGSAFDQVYEMMKKKKQKLMVNSGSTPTSQPPSLSQTQGQVQSQRTDKSDSKNNKNEDDQSPLAGISTSSSSSTVVGILASSGTSSGTKKRKQVRFRDENLTMLHLFEWIEDERINVSRPNFALVEGMFLRQHVSLDDTMDDEPSPPGVPASTGNTKILRNELPNWYRAPSPIELPADIVRIVPGANSEERRVQTERERTVLAAIYFDKSSIPPSAAEPDRDGIYSAVSRQPCTLVPLDDVSELHESEANAVTNGNNYSAEASGNGDADTSDSRPAAEERNNMMQMLSALEEQLASLLQIADGIQLERIRDVRSQVHTLQSRLSHAAPGTEGSLIAEIARIVEPIRELCAQTTQNSQNSQGPQSQPAVPSQTQRQRSWESSARGSRWDTDAHSHSPSYSPPPLDSHNNSGHYSPTLVDRERKRGNSRWGPPAPSYSHQQGYPQRPYGPPRPYPPYGSNYGPPPHGPPYGPGPYSPPHRYGGPIGGPMYPPPRYGDYPGPGPAEPYPPAFGHHNRRPAYAPAGPPFGGYSPHGSS